MSGHALWQDGGRTRHPLTQQHHLHVRCRLFEEMFYCHEVIIIPLRFTATFFVFFFFLSALQNPSTSRTPKLRCPKCLSPWIWPCSIFGGRKKKKKHSQIPERVSFPFCRIIPRHAWTLHLDPSYLCDHSLSFLFVSPPASVEYVKQTYCKLICDNNGVFCWRSTNSQAVCVSTFLPWIAWSCRRQGRKRG